MRNVFPVKYYKDEGFVEHKIEINEEDLEQITEWRWIAERSAAVPSPCGRNRLGYRGAVAWKEGPSR